MSIFNDIHLLSAEFTLSQSIVKDKGFKDKMMNFTFSPFNGLRDGLYKKWVANYGPYYLSFGFPKIF